MALFTRNFVLLWQGQLVSQLGNQAFLIATTFYVLQAGGSPGAVALVLMASTIPLAVLGPIGGAAADRHSRRAILILTDLLRALTIAGLAALIFWRPDATPRHVALIVGAAALNGMMGALFAPAYQALLPDLVPRDRLAAANSVSQMSRQASTLIGQAAGGILYVAWGPAGLLLFDALSFGYAGAATWLLPPEPGGRPTTSLRREVARYVADTREGLSYVWGRAGMTAVLGIFAGVNCLFMPVFVLLPFYTQDVLGEGPVWYGFLLGGSGAGALAGSVAAGLALTPRRGTATLVRGCLVGVACAVLLLALSRSGWLALAAFTAIGVLSSLINVAVITAFQSSVAPQMRGRVMALVIASSTAAVPLGMGLGGLLGDLWRESLPLIVAGCGLAIALLAALSLTVRGFSEALDAGASPGRCTER